MINSKFKQSFLWVLIEVSPATPVATHDMTQMTLITKILGALAWYVMFEKKNSFFVFSLLLNYLKVTYVRTE